MKRFLLIPILIMAASSPSLVQNQRTCCEDFLHRRGAESTETAQRERETATSALSLRPLLLGGELPSHIRPPDFSRAQKSGADAKAGGNPFAGTWKANLSKSRQHANHQFQSATLRFEVSDEAVLLTFTGVNMAGKQESGTKKLHPDGKEYPVAEAPGVVEVAKWADSHTLEVVARKDGIVVGQGTYEVSGDGKTLTARIKGMDAGGAEFEQVIVFDRE